MDNDQDPAVASPVSENDTMKMLLKVTQTLEGSISKLAGAISKKIGDAIGDGTKNGVVEATEEMKSLGKKLLKNMETSLEALPALFQKGGEESAKAMNAALTSIATKLEVPVSLILPEDQMAEISKLISDVSGTVVTKEIAIKIVGYKAAEAVLGLVSAGLSGIAEQEAELIEYSKGAAETFGGTWHAAAAGVKDANGNITTSTRDLTGITDQYSEQVLGLTKSYGLSTTASKRYAEEAAAAGLTLNQLGVFTASAGAEGDKAAQKMSGLSAIFMAASSTGLKFGVAAEYVAQMTRELGVSNAAAVQNIEMFGRAAAGTQLNIKEVSDAVLGGAAQFRMFGNNVQSSAGLFKAFVGTLKEGEQTLARPLFDKVMTGISGMDTGLRAFLGLTTSIGTGGGGAIGGALEVETALETGEGIEKVMDAVKQSIEKMTGSPLLTKDEAMRTGQQQTYQMQRQLMGSQLGVTGAAEQNRTMKMLAGGDFAGFKQMVAPEAGGQGAGFLEGRAHQVATLEAGGATQQLINQFKGFADTFKVSAGKDIIDASLAMRDVGSIFNALSVNLGKVLKMSPNEKVAATDKATADRDKKEIEALGPKAFEKAAPLAAMKSVSRQQDRLKAAPVEYKANPAAVRGKTGAETAAAAASLPNVIERATVRPLEAASRAPVDYLSERFARQRQKAISWQESNKSQSPEAIMASPNTSAHPRRLDLGINPNSLSGYAGSIPPSTISSAALAVTSRNGDRLPSKKEDNSTIRRDVEISFKTVMGKDAAVTFEPYIRKIVESEVAAQLHAPAK